MFASTLELRNALFSFTSVLHQLIKSDLRIYDRKSGVRMFKKTERLKKKLRDRCSYFSILNHLCSWVSWVSTMGATLPLPVFPFSILT